MCRYIVAKRTATPTGMCRLPGTGHAHCMPRTLRIVSFGGCMEARLGRDTARGRSGDDNSTRAQSQRQSEHGTCRGLFLV